MHRVLSPACTSHTRVSHLARLKVPLPSILLTWGFMAVSATASEVGFYLLVALVILTLSLLFNAGLWLGVFE